MSYKVESLDRRAATAAPPKAAAWAALLWGEPPPRPLTGAPPVDAVVKWFKADKGYGFVELAGVKARVLHANALHAAGTARPRGRDARPGRRRRERRAGYPGARSGHRRSCRAPATVDGRSPRPGAWPRSVDGCLGHRKGQMVRRRQGIWLRRERGWRQGVFVHISVLGPAGFASRRRAAGHDEVADTPKGRGAISLSL